MARKIGQLNKKTIEIIEAVRGMVSPEAPSTVRFVLYKLISQGILSSTKDYNKLVNALSQARIRGDLDDSCFADNKRTVSTPPVWENVEQFREQTKSWYSRDHWKTQDNFPIILVEKDTVAQTIREVCSELQVSLFSGSGYCSRPFLCKLAEMILERKRPVQIGYIGDHDASGLDMERAAHFGNGGEGSKARHGLIDLLWFLDGGQEAYKKMTWERIGVTYQDFLGFSGSQLVSVKEETELKKGDPRAKAYIAEYGEFGSEVEALEVEMVQQRVRDFVKKHTDPKAWAASEALEAADREELTQ